MLEKVVVYNSIMTTIQILLFDMKVLKMWFTCPKINLDLEVKNILGN